MDAIPAWVPDNWLMVLFGITAGHILTEIWSLHCRYQHGQKPRRYVKAIVTVFITSSLLTFLGWLTGEPIKAAIYIGILWGCPSPVIWMVIQEAALKYSPALAARLGYDRRISRPDDAKWTEDERRSYRRELFEDTTRMDAVKRDQ